MIVDALQLRDGRHHGFNPGVHRRLPGAGHPPAVRAGARRRRCTTALLLGLFGCDGALADPGYYLLTPYGTPGAVTLDLRYWTVNPSGRQAVLWPEIGVRYGVSDRWTSELFASYIGNSLREQTLSSINWQNSFLLTDGRQPFDLALHVQLIRNRGEGNAIEFGPVFQTEVGLTQLNLNLVFERVWPSAKGTSLKYQAQALQLVGRGVRMGVQAFGELGAWDGGWGTASHRAGPVARVHLFDNWNLQAAYLRGKTYGSRGDMFSAQLTWTY